MKISTIAALFIFLCSYAFSADENNRYQEIEIKFSQSRLTVQQAFDEISRLHDVNVVYNGKEPYLKIMLTLPTKPISVQQALDLIRNQAPVDYIYKNYHIIINSRILKKTYRLSGTVKDVKSNEVLIATNVRIAGTIQGTVTDNDGLFILELPPGTYELDFSYMGYKSKQFNLNLFEDKTIQVFLEETQQKIDEVSIIGTLGEIKDLEIGRPIEHIDSKTIDRLNTNVVNDALHGRVNGVWTTKVSGAPGDHNRIRIRGINSIFASADPLYVVDGMIIPLVNLKTLGIADLNSHDVESITVLKDASSTALYGYMGGNGVILIETKEGGGETKFNFSVKQGMQWLSKRYSLLNAEDFYNTLELSDKNIHTPFYTVIPKASPPKYELYPYYRDSLGNTLGSDNFQDELFQCGNISEFQLSGQGSTKMIDYYLSGNYYTHKGIVTNTWYDKYNFTANLSKNIREKISLRLLYKGSWQENKNNLDNYLGNPLIYKGISYEPAYRFTPDSFLRKSPRLYLGPTSYLGNTYKQLADHRYSPDMLFYQNAKTKTEGSNALNFQGIYKINGDFSFHTFLSLASKNIEYCSFLPEYHLVKEKYLKSNEQFIIFSQQYDLHYKKLFNNHNLSAFFRYRNYSDNAFWVVDSLMNVELDGLKPEDMIYLRGSQAIFGDHGSVIRSVNSAILNVNYGYRKKYFLSFIANLDRLNEGAYVDVKEVFYSMAIDYDLSKEKFLSVPDWINALHLYANVGHVGNYPLNSLSNDMYSSRNEYTVSDTVRKATITDNLANHYLKHEKVIEFNFGTRISLFRNRMTLSGDYYIKHYSDLLMQRTIPYYYAGGWYYQNIGEMENKGIELSLEFTPVDRPDFFWTTRFNFSSDNQVITKLYDGQPISFNDIDILYPDFYARENEALGDITGYRYCGTWNNNLHAENVSGEIKYFKHKGLAYLKLDALQPRILNEHDKTIIGNSIPDFTCNWLNMIRYKYFTCEMLWYAVLGVDKYNATRACTYIAGTNSQVRQLVLDSMSFHMDNKFYESSYFVEDASFIRLKTLSFRYIQPKKIARRVGIEYAVSFENLITLTRYTGYDPEATIYTNNNFTDNAMDVGSYPNPKGVFFSINLSF
ncbi:MAG: SusC/RagA family TonB-linked outer membrane protein [Bacteroidales bacterium]